MIEIEVAALSAFIVFAIGFLIYAALEKLE
jgi:hypothetical protein